MNDKGMMGDKGMPMDKGMMGEKGMMGDKGMQPGDKGIGLCSKPNAPVKPGHDFQLRSQASVTPARLAKRKPAPARICRHRSTPSAPIAQRCA